MNIEKSKTKGKIFNIQRFSIHDGPGIRTIVFMKGCPLRCLWCSNPESQKLNDEIVYLKSSCRKCKNCELVCKRKAIAVEENRVAINRKICNNCGECIQVCPNRALKKIGEEYTVEEVINEIEKDRAFYVRSGGGVTFSGGEPFFQPSFLLSLLRKCHLNGFHTCVETSGYQQWEIIRELLGEIDLVLYDIKEIDTQKHIKFTGVDNKLITENAKKIANYGVPLVIRIPIIPNLNVDSDSISRFGQFIKELKNIKGIVLVPYHKYGVSKYESLGRNYSLKDIDPPSKECLKKIKESLESYNLNVKIQIGG